MPEVDAFSLNSNEVVKYPEKGNPTPCKSVCFFNYIFDCIAGSWSQLLFQSLRLYCRILYSHGLNDFWGPFIYLFLKI